MTTKNDEEHKFEVRKTVEEIIAQLVKEAQARQLAVRAPAADRLQDETQTLSAEELKSVYALLAFVAHNENVPQETVQSIVEASFGVNHVAKLQHRSYDEVIRFLVDLRLDEVKN